LKNYKERDLEIQKLAVKLWGSLDGQTIVENHYGNGKVFWNKNLKEVLMERNVGSDFNFKSGSDSINMDFIHRRTASEDIYFLSNKTDGTENINGIFRVSGRVPEIWDPETGNILSIDQYVDDGKSTTIPLLFDQQGSLFVVFRKHATGEQFLSGKYNPDPFIPAGEIEMAGSWEINFPPGWGAPEHAKITELISWSDSDNPGIKYFSGIVTYNKTFNIPEELISGDAIIRLNLGEVHEVAEVYLNSESLGILWKPPYTVDITKASKPGENQLIIEVANTWNNRLVGEAHLPENERFTKTNITGPNWQTRIPWKDSPLLPSGLLGPVSIQVGN